MTVKKVSFEEARSAILEGAKSVGYPNLSALEKQLATNEPRDQIQGIQDALDGLALHTDKKTLLDNSRIMDKKVGETTNARQLNSALKSMCREVPGLVSMLTEGGAPPAEEQLEHPTPGKENSRKTYNERHWNLIVATPYFRQRLMDANVLARSQALGVNYLDEETYPYNRDQAKALDETQLAKVYADLERAAMSLCDCPSLEAVIRLNAQIDDAQKEGFISPLLARIPDNLIKNAKRLVELDDPRVRMKMMLTRNSMTATLVETISAAYADVIQEQSKPSATALPLKRVEAEPSSATRNSSKEKRQNMKALDRKETDGAAGDAVNDDDPVSDQREAKERPAIIRDEISRWEKQLAAMSLERDELKRALEVQGQELTATKQALQQKGELEVNEEQVKQLVSAQVAPLGEGIKNLGQKIDPLVNKIGELEKKAPQLTPDQLQKLAKLTEKSFLTEETLTKQLVDFQTKADERAQAVKTAAANQLTMLHNDFLERLPALVRQNLPVREGTDAATAGQGETSTVITRTVTSHWSNPLNWLAGAAVIILLFIFVSAMPNNGGQTEQTEPLFQGPTLQERLKDLPSEDELAESGQ